MAEQIHVTRYTPASRKPWNDFIRDSKNGIFIYNRDFMEYHSDRYEDHSLLFTDSNENLQAVFPANIDGKVLRSHGGLTFGGVVSGKSMTLGTMLNVFQSLVRYMHEHGIDGVEYKAVPYFYHRIPSEEDLYALFVNQAVVVKRDVSSVIMLSGNNGELYSRLRRRKLKNAFATGMNVSRSFEFGHYMELLSDMLKERHNAAPVHTREEIERLAALFPENIKLFVAVDGESTIHAGAIVFEHENVLRVQYSASSVFGRENGAVDLVYDYLIKTYERKKQYLDLGTSMTTGSNPINEGLLSFKESFGARTVATDTYKLAAAN